MIVLYKWPSTPNFGGHAIGWSGWNIFPLHSKEGTLPLPESILGAMIATDCRKEGREEGPFDLIPLPQSLNRQRTEYCGGNNITIARTT